MPTKFKISDDDREAIIRNRASGKPAAERTGFIGVVDFRGPRGGKYRPVWYAVRLTPEEALADVEKIYGKRYARGAAPVADDIVEINAYGEAV